eukprot:scaffold69083_cov40-Prasinocladus_malaysianus.AAC.1
MCGVRARTYQTSNYDIVFRPGAGQRLSPAIAPGCLVLSYLGTEDERKDGLTWTRLRGREVGDVIHVNQGNRRNGAGKIRKAGKANDRTKGFDVLIAVRNAGSAQKETVRERGVKTPSSGHGLTRGWGRGGGRRVVPLERVVGRSVRREWRTRNRP